MSPGRDPQKRAAGGTVRVDLKRPFDRAQRGCQISEIQVLGPRCAMKRASLGSIDLQGFLESRKRVVVITFRAKTNPRA
ncbi:MAG: hypothetical protein ABSC06_30570 [Rhodopila sp.]|jgi:hypothetical protein